jgi:polysaccharide deacetylase 2 family uncharacterized protein YibQ
MTDSRDSVADELSAPLGVTKRKPRFPVIPPAALPITAGALGSFAALVLGWALFADGPFGGEPIATASVDLHQDRGAERARGEPKPIDPSRSSSDQPSRNDRPNRYDGPEPKVVQPATPIAVPSTVTIIDGTNGKRQEVAIPGPAAQKGVGEEPIDPRVAERSAQGVIPKIAPDGTRPAEAFAQPVKALPGKSTAPRIAIVVEGLGISAAGTAEALAKLPGPVTLAFAPYGDNLPRLAARGRESGHELLLQVPMEPFDYPNNDPGPQALLTSLDAAQNVGRFRWLMSRMQGYVGIINYMGARFTTSEPALAPILREMAMRGLIYVEDGSVPRSLASDIAGANNLPFARADLAIDAAPSTADIDRSLARLERAARERSYAVGVANALPAAIDRVAAWAKGAETRGIQLVPISAIANRTSKDRMSDVRDQK